MDTKQMTIADLNLVFGKKEEPMIKWVDNLILPAMNSGIAREADKQTKYFFWNVKLGEIREDEFVISGVLIKDTILDVDSRFHQGEGMEHLNLHVPSSPYSAFIIYLRNHKMALVKNGKGSPNLKNFSATLKEVLYEYTKRENEKLKSENKKDEFFPHSILNVTGIKTDESVRNAMRGVKKINHLKLKFFPLNSQWDDGSLVGAIDEQWRKVMQSKNASLQFRTPQSKEGVISVVEKLDGYVNVELEVEYDSDSVLEGKNTTIIKNNKLAENTYIDISKELDESIDEIDGYCKRKKNMNKVTNNLIVDYEEFLKRKRK